MSQYIDNANQEILWKTFHKIPQVNNMEYSRKEILFKNAISHIYHSATSTNLNKDQLQEMNRHTMKILLENIVPVHETKEETTQRNFEDKQRQYDQMTEKPNVPKPAGLFQDDSLEEGAILNINERIEAYQRQRELDMPTTVIALPSSESLRSEESLQSTKSSESLRSEESLQSESLKLILESIKKIESRLQLLESKNL